MVQILDAVAVNHGYLHENRQKGSNTGQSESARQVRRDDFIAGARGVVFGVSIGLLVWVSALAVTLAWYVV